MAAVQAPPPPPRQLCQPVIKIGQPPPQACGPLEQQGSQPGTVPHGLDPTVSESNCCFVACLLLNLFVHLLSLPLRVFRPMDYCLFSQLQRYILQRLVRQYIGVLQPLVAPFEHFREASR